MKIAIGNDHAAPQLKNAVKKHLEERGFEVVDVGCAEGERCDYPDKAVMVCEKVVSGECGLGMSYAANKVKGIRAACCSDYFSARLSREHNNANVLCFGARVVGEGTALDLVDIFVDTPFSGDERHQRRLDKITAIEQQ